MKNDRFLSCYGAAVVVSLQLCHFIAKSEPIFFNKRLAKVAKPAPPAPSSRRNDSLNTCGHGRRDLLEGNGPYALDNQFPWMVELRSMVSWKVCTGVLVSSDLVLASADCLEKDYEFLAFINRHNTSVSAEQEVSLERTYSRRIKLFVYDLTLLKLYRNLSSEFPPICWSQKACASCSRMVAAWWNWGSGGLLRKVEVKCTGDLSSSWVVTCENHLNYDTNTSAVLMCINNETQGAYLLGFSYQGLKHFSSLCLYKRLSPYTFQNLRDYFYYISSRNGRRHMVTNEAFAAPETTEAPLWTCCPSVPTTTLSRGPVPSTEVEWWWWDWWRTEATAKPLANPSVKPLGASSDGYSSEDDNDSTVTAGYSTDAFTTLSTRASSDGYSSEDDNESTVTDGYSTDALTTLSTRRVFTLRTALTRPAYLFSTTSPSPSPSPSPVPQSTSRRTTFVLPRPATMEPARWGPVFITDSGHKSSQTIGSTCTFVLAEMVILTNL